MSWRGRAIFVVFLLASGAGEAYWKPTPELTFDYLLGVTPRLPPQNTEVVFLDGFDKPKATVTRYRERGVKVVCYINVGAWEDWRPDKDRIQHLPPTTAEVFAVVDLGCAPTWVGNWPEQRTKPGAGVGRQS